MIMIVLKSSTRVNRCAGPAAKKQKDQTASFPFLEHFLALWIDEAEEARVLVTDDIIRIQADIIQSKLTDAGVDEQYDGFEMSSGWLARFKSRHNFGILHKHGQSAVDQAALPAHRAHLAAQLASYAPCDRYNCDESGLVFNKQPRSSNVRLIKERNVEGEKTTKPESQPFTY